uniref:Zinc finger protein 574 n=1 Tax=Hippocampus comes TaxID=109280 RepID=A0A3Q2XWL0_HIPCM
METQSVYMCFPCYKEFNTLEEVLKHQMTCTAEEDQADSSRIAPVVVPVLQTQAELNEDHLLDQPRILYQCGDCEELFKSLDLWQHHRKEGACLRTVVVGGSEAEPQSSFQPEDPQPVAEGDASDAKSDQTDASEVKKDERQVGETSTGDASDQAAPEVITLSSALEESSPRRRGALKKPKPDPVLLCVDCGSCFGLVSELVAHRKTHGFEEALHHCTVCGESFLNTTLFLYHRKQHRQKGEGSSTVASSLSEKTYPQSSMSDGQEPDGAPSSSSAQPTELFLCLQCGGSFNTAAVLAAHRKGMHDLHTPLHSCSYCTETFMNTTQYLYHRRQHRMASPVEEAQSSKRPLPLTPASESDGVAAVTVDTANLPPPAKLLQDWSRTALPHVCPYCGKTFTRRVFLRTHVYSHTGEKLFTCKVCSKSFTNSQSLLRHTMSHSGNRPFCCDVCGKDFTQAATLKRHQLIHTSDQPRRKRGRKPVPLFCLFSCPLCPSHFNTEEQLNHHKLLHTSNPFPCPDCGEAFSRRKDLDLHSLIHQDKEPVVCPHCSSQFINESVLEIHQQRCTGSEEERNTGRGRGQGRGRSTGQIECDLCGHRCMTQEGLDLHRLSHTGQTPLKCPVRPCRRRFISNKALEEHVLAHCQGKMSKPKGRVRFECEICFKGFAYNSTFQVHMRTHTNERPFECTTCGKCFRQLPHLQDHERIHSGVRPFCCWICGKSFSVAARLTEHARTHSGEKPYPCPNCPAAFRSRSNLDKHIRQHGDQAAQAVEDDCGGMQTIYVLQAGEGGGEAVMIPAEELSGMDGTSQVVILPSSMLGAQGITIPTITMDGSEITMMDGSQSPQHSIEFIVEETI